MNKKEKKIFEMILHDMKVVQSQKEEDLNVARVNADYLMYWMLEKLEQNELAEVYHSIIKLD
jgi:hypothetical protein